MNKKILMICYYFPPLTDVGCKRSLAFARYLKKNNWKPYVLSVKNPDKNYCTLGTEPPPEGISVDYTYSLVNPIRFLGRMNGLLNRVLGLFNRSVKRNYFYEFLCIPDFFVGWVPLSIFRALKLIRSHGIDTIYVSCSPFSASLIGVACRFLTKKKLILDFRDPYGLRAEGAWVSRLRERIDALFVAFFLKHTDMLIVTTDETHREYIAQYPEFKSKFHVIHNGFDSINLIDTPVEKYKKFTIIYTGQFYYNFNTSLNMFADTFFSALAVLKQEKKICRDTFQFVFYGDERLEIEDYTLKYDLEDLVSIHGRIGYTDVLQRIRQSHLQLLRIVKMMLSTKLFEGIPLNVPFLATIPPGEAEAIIQRYSPASYIVTDEFSEKIKFAIENAMITYRKGAVPDNHVDLFMDTFSREKLTEKLIGLIGTLEEEKGSCVAKNSLSFDGL